MENKSKKKYFLSILERLLTVKFSPFDPCSTFMKSLRGQLPTHPMKDLVGMVQALVMVKIGKNSHMLTPDKKRKRLLL